MPNPRRARKRPRPVAARIEIFITGEDLERWSRAAERQNITLLELVRESVETCIARGSTR